MQGIKKTFTISGSKGTSAQVTVTETYDIATNTSVLSVALAVACSSYYGHTYYLNGTLSAAGQTLQTMNSSAGTHRVTISQLNTYAGVSGSPWSTAAITHNNDGSKTVTVALDIKGYEASGRGASGFTISGSRSLTLTQIPRASTVQATDATIGAASLISVSRKSAEYTHSVAFSFGSLSGYLAADGTVSAEEIRHTATSIAFPIPEDFYYEIPDAPSAACTVTCATYLGDAQVGERQTCDFTVTADPALCAPLVTGQVEDVNEATVALTGDNTALVRYASKVKCTITATPRFGAAITEKTVDGTIVEDTVILSMGEQVLFAATDSRGYQTAETVTARVVPYVPLTCRAAAKRDDPTSGRVTLTVSGECYNGSFGAADNALTLRCQAGAGEWVDLTPVFQDHTYTATVVLTELDYNQRHTITVEAADRLSSAQASASVDKGLPVFHWGENDFTFQVPVHANAGIFKNGNPYSAGDVGAAPDGFGLGADCQSIDSFENITTSGFYCADAGVPAAGRWYGYGAAMDAGAYVTLTAWSEDGKSRCQRTKTPDGWNDWAWENPPMTAGVEYRTTERYNGKPVYVKLVNCGAGANTTEKKVSHGATNAIVFDFGGYHYINGSALPMPYYGYVGLYVTSKEIIMKTTANYSNYTAYVWLKYYKTTD